MNIGRIVREVEAKPLEQPDVAPLEPEIPDAADDQPEHRDVRDGVGRASKPDGSTEPGSRDSEVIGGGASGSADGCCRRGARRNRGAPSGTGRNAWPHDRLFGWNDAGPHTSGITDERCQCAVRTAFMIIRSVTMAPSDSFWELEYHFSGSGGLVLGIAEASGRVPIGARRVGRAEYASASALFISNWAFPNPEVEAASLALQRPAATGTSRR